MRTNRIVWVTAIIGLGIVFVCYLLSQLLSFYWEEATFTQVFNWGCVILGFIANLAIVAAAVKFFTKETLDIEGYGKIRISRMQNNIQDLTNLLSRDFHEGRQFSRDPLLKAFYKDVKLDYIERYTTKPEEKSIMVSIGGKSLSIKQNEVRDVQQVIQITKYLLNDCKDLDNATLESIYKQWYDSAISKE